MKKKVWKQVLTATFCFMLFFGTMTVQAEETIKHSTVDYDASFYDAGEIFIGNEKAVDWEVGDKYFLHYTVTEVTKDDTNQSGVIVTTAPEHNFPHEKGGMHFGTDVPITEEGWTYLFRFEVTESGLKYIAGKAKGTESSYVQFPFAVGELKTKGPYFGVWISGTEGQTLTAKFRNIRCYDEYGNDLGIIAPKATQIRESDMNSLDVAHSYSFSVANVACFAFGGAKYSKSDVIILEYTVSNVKAQNVTQSGAEFTNAPTAYYPHTIGMGHLKFDFNTDKEPAKLITEGASYLVRFERQKDTFNVLTKRTMPNGAVDYFTFAINEGSYNPDFGYVAMWIGQECDFSADFTNVKCYDGKGNNLGVQTNKGVIVTHYGDLEDYTQCAADYYCKENQTIITLNKECDASVKCVGETKGTSGVYSIREGILKLKVNNAEEEYSYAYEYIKDAEGNKYVRLRENSVTFVSKSIGGEVLSTEIVSAETGWKVAKPEDPTGGNGKFTGWVDGSNKEYDFNEIVTEAKILYATWDGDQEWEVLQSLINGSNWTLVITGVVCILLIGGTVTASILFIRRRSKRGR